MPSRQQWLRDRGPEGRFEKVDPLPVEAAVVGARTETLMDMVQRQVRASLMGQRPLDEDEPDDVELRDLPEPDSPTWTRYQVQAQAQDMQSDEDLEAALYPSLSEAAVQPASEASTDLDVSGPEISPEAPSSDTAD